MSEHEFEAYLNLLARTLRLSETQRTRIAGELRDHLEARMTELIEEEHLSKEEAVLAALDEFGDANVLAHDLTGPATQLKRKRIMQTGFSVIATAAVVAVAATWLTPTNFQGHPTQTVATAAGEADAAPVARVAPADDATSVLDRPLTVNYTNTPLEEVFEDIATHSGLNMYVDWWALNEAEAAAPDSEVNLQLKDVPLRTVLEFVLYSSTAGLAHSGFKDGVLVVTATEGDYRTLLELPRAETETFIYDCSDLLDPALMLSETNANYREAAQQLQRVIAHSLGEGAWTKDTSVSQFGTLLVVRQTEAAHEKIASILNKLETATAEIAEKVAYEQGVARQQRLEAEKTDITLREEMEALEMEIALQTNMILSNDRQLANAEVEEKEHLLATNSVLETEVSEAKKRMERMKLKLVR